MIQRLNPAQKLRISLGVMLLILLFGTLGYRYIEGWDWLDSLYMTVITLATVGYREAHPLSQNGVLFTIFLIFAGMFVLVYAAQSATRLIIGGEVGKHMGRIKMEKSVRRMKNHYILCGFGRIGRRICDEFKAEKVDFVVIDRDIDLVAEMMAEDIPYIQGEAASDEVLIAAGVERAKTIITAVNSPADNVFITLTARGLNSGIFIVARSESKDMEQKLFRAGASKVVYPHAIGGRQMALAALRPAVVKFLEMEFLREKYGVYMEEIQLAKGSPLCCKSLRDVALTHNFGLTIIGIIRDDDEVTFNPGPDTVLSPGDNLIIFGSADQLKRLAQLASSKA